MKSKTWGLWAACTAGLAVALGAAWPAEAAVVRTGGTITVPAGETIDDDFYAFGRDVVVDGTVKGDLVALGGHVTVNGRVLGNVSAAGGEVTLPVGAGESVRAAGGQLTVGGGVGRDLLSFASTLKTRPDLRVHGQAYLSGKGMDLVGDYGRSLSATGQDIRFAGSVGGPATLSGQTVHVEDGAHVAGVLSVDATNANPVAPGVTAEEIKVTQATAAAKGWGGKLSAWVLLLGMGLVSGLLLLWLLPESAERSSHLAMEAPAGRMLWGIVAFVLVPVLAAVAMMTLVGLPAGMILLGVYLIALYLAPLVVGEAVGETILARKRPVHSTGERFAALALGLVILYLLMAIPYLGGLVAFLVLIWGLGTLMSLVKQNMRGERGRAAPNP